MKTISLYDQIIDAYQPQELDLLKEHGAEAARLWFEEWQKQGAADQGTCCGGKSLRVWYLDKGKRKPMEMTITRCNWVQGNLSASASVQPALDYLKEQGIEAEYYDGWMD
jgi:hypothetical protein